MAMNEGSEITFDIIEEIGIISTQETGWTRELNLVRWNGGIEKYDIREWDPYHERMSRGITLKEDEMRRILDLMKKRKNKSWSRNISTTAPEDVAMDMAGRSFEGEGPADLNNFKDEESGEDE
ncbi:MAG: PC4/YdbC family ssDNA-binding protein [Eubacteriales bacterium]|nr:PC4/YdbC family ssDNA-binding protein [Eubacteriales bacterium]